MHTADKATCQHSRVEGEISLKNSSLTVDLNVRGDLEEYVMLPILRTQCNDIHCLATLYLASLTIPQACITFLYFFLILLAVSCRRRFGDVCDEKKLFPSTLCCGVVLRHQFIHLFHFVRLLFLHEKMCPPLGWKKASEVLTTFFFHQACKSGKSRV